MSAPDEAAPASATPAAAQVEAETRNIVCIKWGTAYGADYVNRLARAVARHLTPPYRFICFTDAPHGLDPGIEARPIPPITVPAAFDHRPWRKISLWTAPLADVTGTALFLDLDTVVTGPLDGFFTFAPGRFCIVENPTKKGRGIGNSSVYRWRIGAHTHLYADYLRDPAAIHARYKISQEYISAEIGGVTFWPPGWVAMFKRDCLPPLPQRLWQAPRLPDAARVVIFPGRPNPDDALIGHWPEKLWYKRLYKRLRPSPWIAAHWR